MLERLKGMSWILNNFSVTKISINEPFLPIRALSFLLPVIKQSYSNYFPGRVRCPWPSPSSGLISGPSSHCENHKPGQSEFLWAQGRGLGPKWWWGWENVLLFMTGAGRDHAPLALSDHCLQSFSFPICRSLIKRPARFIGQNSRQANEPLFSTNNSKEWVYHDALII